MTSYLTFSFILGGGCSAPVGVSTSLKKPFDSQHKLSITGAVWSLDGKTKIDHNLTHTFPQIRKSQKHKLSPTEETDNKKTKYDNGGSSNELVNPVEQLNRKIDEKVGNLNCEDTEKQLFCGMTENPNIPLDVIIKCDSLGRDLANELIKKGALEVMKVTQDLIRSSINKDC